MKNEPKNKTGSHAAGVLMWQAASKFSQPQVEYLLSGQSHDFVAVFPQCR